MQCRVTGADPADYVRQVPMIARNAALVTGLSIVPIFLLGYLVIRFLLPDFMPSVLPMAILCVAVIPSSHLRVVLAAASMQGFQRVLYGYSVAGVVLSVCYLPAATKGALGVAMASLVIYLVLQVAVLRWWRGQARKITRVRRFRMSSRAVMWRDVESSHTCVAHPGHPRTGCDRPRPRAATSIGTLAAGAGGHGQTERSGDRGRQFAPRGRWAAAAVRLGRLTGQRQLRQRDAVGAEVARRRRLRPRGPNTGVQHPRKPRPGVRRR